jgi:hypothetical protein
MIVIPFEINAQEFNMFVVLENDNLERMKLFDPAQVDLSKLSGNFRHKRLNTLIVGYGTAEDIQRVLALAKEGKVQDGLKYLSRGFAFRPEAGDNDGPYLSLRKQEGEVEQ